MTTIKKIGTLLTCSALTFGMYASVANASLIPNEQTERVQIEVAASENTFNKNDLIKRFYSLFPNRFSFLSPGDFQMGNGYYYPNDETMRYDLSFTKVVDGKRIYGSVGFIGENLDVENFSYSPANTSDALFPAKVSKEEALTIANNFMKGFAKGEEFQLETNTFNYYPRQMLTEPIMYSFTYSGTQNGVSIPDIRTDITVLGNGEITGFYRSPIKKNKATFDDVKMSKSEAEMLQKVKDNLQFDLRYQLTSDYRTNETDVKLVYQPTTGVRGINAITGKWLVANDYSDTYPTSKKVEKLSATPLPAKYNGVTMDEAKKIAEKLLAVPSDKVKVSIESIGEVTHPNGQEMYSIQYTYQMANSGHGSSIEINKQTGEVIHYYDMKNQLLEQLGIESPKDKKISQEEALAKAIGYVKEWVPSLLHNYASPIEEPYYEESQGFYHFTFPRVVNGIGVIGDQISVGIARDGSLGNLNVGYTDIVEWPSVEKVLSTKEAKNKFDNALSLKLAYLKQKQDPYSYQYQNVDNQHYDLVYVPLFNKDMYSTLDATTGEWKSLYSEEPKALISHPWAEDELNYLIQASILKVDKNFTGDAVVSRGEALQIIISSLSYFYDGMYYDRNETPTQSFANIGPDHPSYQAIERGLEMGIIQATGGNFAIDAPITREELATWYVRALGLEQAAKHKDIFKLTIKDANKVNAGAVGYVALANSLGLFDLKQNEFHPDQEVSYAELAVSIIRLAHEMADKGRSIYY